MKRGAHLRRLLIFFGCGWWLMLTACGTTVPNHTLTLGSSDFTGPTVIEIRAGQNVIFDDPSSSGGYHVLLTGTGGNFTPSTGAPPPLNSTAGLILTAGQSQTITFPVAGTFGITCTIHPGMAATIIVDP